MPKYCKAYKLKDVRQFSGWKENYVENAPELSDDNICYLWDDFTVVRSPIQKETVLFASVTPEWQNFCRTTLKFDIPEDLRDTNQQPSSLGTHHDQQ